MSSVNENVLPVLAGVAEHPLSGAGLALTAAEVAIRSAPVRGRAVEFETKAPRRGARHVEPLVLPELLGQVVVIEFNVDGRHEGRHAFSEVRGQTAVAGAAPKTMNQARGSALFEPAAQGTHLPGAEL